MGQNFQPVLWLDGHKLNFYAFCAWLVCAGGGCEVQGTGLSHTLWTCSNYPLRSYSHTSESVSHLQPRLASNTREQIPKLWWTAFFFFLRCPLLILISKLGVNKLFGDSERKTKPQSHPTLLVCCSSSFGATPHSDMCSSGSHICCAFLIFQSVEEKLQQWVWKRCNAQSRDQQFPKDVPL